MIYQGQWDGTNHVELIGGFHESRWQDYGHLIYNKEVSKANIKKLHSQSRLFMVYDRGSSDVGSRGKLKIIESFQWRCDGIFVVLIIFESVII